MQNQSMYHLMYLRLSVEELGEQQDLEAVQGMGPGNHLLKLGFVVMSPYSDQKISTLNCSQMTANWNINNNFRSK